MPDTSRVPWFYDPEIPALFATNAAGGREVVCYNVGRDDAELIMQAVNGREVLLDAAEEALAALRRLGQPTLAIRLANALQLARMTLAEEFPSKEAVEEFNAEHGG